MSEKIKSNRPTAYFAAANGFCGFVSYFDKIFAREEFERIYILKGGPGTGKSTLMKRITEYAARSGIYYEEIYCSSDYNSLDGVILQKDKKKIAILDGTAPHIYDPQYPGSVEEIINLQDGFDIPGLISKRNEIISLGKEKKNSYESAYSYLAAAGCLFDNLFKKAASALSENAFLNEAERYLTDVGEINRSEPQIHCLTAFGKDGIKRLKCGYHTDTKAVTVSGSSISRYVALSVLKRYSEAHGLITELYIHPFSASIYDAVITNNAMFTASGEMGEAFICADEYIKPIPNFEDGIEEYERLLSLSQKAFKAAAEAHLSIEAIYKNYVDFKNNDRIYFSLLEVFDKMWG